MAADHESNQEANVALSWTSSICSILGLVAVIVLQKVQFDDYTLLFWWLTAALIAIAALSTCFSQPSFPLRAVFAIVFVAQLPAFNWTWSEIYERDTVMSLRVGTPSEQEKKIDNLERENARLAWQWRKSLLFWEAISHLAGMGFALLACTAAGQRRIRIVYDAG